MCFQEKITKISDFLENQFVEMTNNNYLARQVAKKLEVCHRIVLQVRKRKNLSTSNKKIWSIMLAVVERCQGY